MAMAAPTRLATTGIECEVVHKRLFAGPGAAAMLQRSGEREQPNVVVLSTSTFGVVTRLMSNRIRERWGERAGSLAKRAENFGREHRRAISRNGPTAAVFRRVGKVAGRIIGTSRTHSIENLVRCYDDSFRSPNAMARTRLR